MDKTIEFYNVKTRAFIEVPTGTCKKKIYTRETSKGTQYRYAIRATILDDGKDGLKTMLTKFVNKETFDSLNIPVEE